MRVNGIAKVSGALLSFALAAGAWAQGPTNALKAASTDNGAHLTTEDVNKPADGFVIGDNDVLAVSVWKEPDVSRSVPVRSDGKISLPLVGEVQAAGNTPRKLEQDITARLKNYMAEPEVTVIVQQVNSQKFNILGQVNKPGSYPLANSTTVLDAIAIAGGFRDFAKQKGIYVLRPSLDGNHKRIPFNYKDVVKGHNAEQNIRLEARDTIVVP